MPSALLAVLLLLSAGALGFLPHIDYPFQFDDQHSIVENPSIRSFTQWHAWLTDLSAFSVLPENLNYRPLLLASYAVSYRIAGLEPWGFRLLNILIHFVAAFLVYEIARRLAAESSAWSPPLRSGPGFLPPTAEGLGLLAGLVFLLHPALVEPVNYISARSESLAAACVLLAFALRLAADRATDSGGKGRTVLLATGSITAYSAGLLTKEIAICLPALVVWKYLALGMRGERSAAFLRQRISYFVALGVVTSAYLLWRAHLIPPSVVAARASVGHATYFLTQLRAWPHYLREFVWPVDLHVDNTDFGWSERLTDPRVLSAIGSLALVLLLAILLHRRAPLVGFGLGWFWIAILPASSVFPLAEPVNGHRSYLGGAGLAIAGSSLLWTALGWLEAKTWSSGWRRVLAGVPLLLLLVLGCLTWERCRVWRSSASLWGEVVARSPGNGRGWMNLGLAEMAAGDFPAATLSFDRAVTCAPNYALAYVNRAILRRAQGDTAGATSDTKASLELAPGNIFVQHWAAKHDAETGNLAAAAEHAERACLISPRHVPSLVLSIEIASRQGDGARIEESVRALGRLGPVADEGRATAAVSLLTAARPAPALELLEPVIARHPGWNGARFNLGYTYLQLGRLSDAEREFQAVLAREPGNAGAQQNLLWIKTRQASDPARDGTGG